MYPEHLLYERIHPADQDPGLFRRQGGHQQLHPVAGYLLCRHRHPLQRDRPRLPNQNRKLLFNEDGTPTPRTAKILAGTPMGRFVESNELLGGVFFLCDDRAASAITGVVLPIDAGFAAYSGV